MTPVLEGMGRRIVGDEAEGKSVWNNPEYCFWSLSHMLLSQVLVIAKGP